MRTAAPPAPPSVSEREAPRRSASRGFDGLVAVLSAVFGGGLYLDGWAHVHGHVDQSFFTPWHAALYSGFLVVAAVIGATAWAGLRRGLPLRESVPTGYEVVRADPVLRWVFAQMPPGSVRTLTRSRRGLQARVRIEQPGSGVD